MSANTEVKIVSDSGRNFTVAGYGVIFSDSRSPDLTGDFFTKNTDFWFDKIAETPMVLYQHGKDDVLKRTIVGRVTSKRQDDIGLWVEAQITAAKQYADAIRELVSKGVLGWSSGSVPHLVERTKSGRTSEITSWPIVELSLTPTPAEPRTVGVRELKALAAVDPLLTIISDEAEAAESKAAHIEAPVVVQAAKEERTLLIDLPDSAFAHVEPGGAERKTVPRHFPHHDENGQVDVEGLKAALADPNLLKFGALPAAHLLRHAQAAGVWGRPIQEDDAHEPQWAKGLAPLLLVREYRTGLLAEAAAKEFTAHVSLGYDTKDGMHVSQKLRQQLIDEDDESHALVTKQNEIEQGIDGVAIVETFRTAFQLLDLEEVA